MSILTACPSTAQISPPPSASSVFRLAASRGENGALELRWTIAVGNYLYREKIKIQDMAGNLLAATLPPGTTEDDSNFGQTEIYHNNLSAGVPASALAGLANLRVTYQGCAERGICYPSLTSDVNLTTFQVTTGGTAARLRR